jgi:hypothetical protein
MATVIYIAGLGQLTNDESVEEYAVRYIKELKNNTPNTDFYTKIEKVYFNKNQSSLVVRIYQQTNGTAKLKEDKLVDTFYDFKYKEHLNQKFQNYSLFFQNSLVLLLVIKKLPSLISSLFKKSAYSKGGQTFYMFILFLIMTLAIVLLVPSFTLVFDIFNFNNQMYVAFKENYADLIKISMSIIILYILLVPQSNTILNKVAAEFTTIDNYIQSRKQAQVIQENLNTLIEYILENDDDIEIHLHTYSFGSIIALDALFPIGNAPCANIQNNVKQLITIGAPYEFIKNFYPNFYNNRIGTMTKNLQWINVYSTLDAFASNFRADNKSGKAHYGIMDNKEGPLNLNYETNRYEKFNVFSFITLKHIKRHKSYWLDSNSGQSCTRLILNKIKELEYLNV